MFFKSKRKLKQEINLLLKANALLREEIEHHKRRGALMDATPLPKCEGLACLGCRKAIYRTDEYGEVHLIGCGKDMVCKEYEQASIPSTEEQRELLRRQGVWR